MTPTEPKHIFDTAIALAPNHEGHYTGHTHPAYGNMVGPFGGVIGAALLNGIMQHPQRLGDPLSLTSRWRRSATRFSRAFSFAGRNGWPSALSR